MIDNKIKSRSMVVSEFGYDPYQVQKEIELEEAKTINNKQEVIQDEETTNEGTKPTEINKAIDVENRTIEIAFASETPVKRDFGEGIGVLNEILKCTPDSVNLSRYA
jgi:hypothetical protein